jgi:hypothetical protein
MVDSTRTAWISALNEELEQAEEHELRWTRLGEQLHKTASEQWKITAQIRKAEVDLLKLLIQTAAREER